MKFLLVVTSAADAPAARAAVSFAQAALASEHELAAVFFHADGVTHGLTSAAASDEWRAADAWSALADQLMLWVCPTSLGRRVDAASALGQSFDSKTLGQVITMLDRVDRVVRL